MVGWGSATRVQKATIFNYQNFHQQVFFIPTLMMNFGRKLPIFKDFCEFQSKPSIFREYLLKKVPCLENFGPKNPYGRHMPVPSTCCVPSLGLRAEFLISSFLLKTYVCSAKVLLSKVKCMHCLMLLSMITLQLFPWKETLNFQPGIFNMFYCLSVGWSNYRTKRKVPW